MLFQNTQIVFTSIFSCSVSSRSCPMVSAMASRASRESSTSLYVADRTVSWISSGCVNSSTEGDTDLSFWGTGSGDSDLSKGETDPVSGVIDLLTGEVSLPSGEVDLSREEIGSDSGDFDLAEGEVVRGDEVLSLGSSPSVSSSLGFTCWEYRRSTLHKTKVHNEEKRQSSWKAGVIK